MYQIFDLIDQELILKFMNHYCKNKIKE